MAATHRPLEADNLRAQVDRTYHGGGPLQWVRETYMNAVEAEATRVEYLVEWQAVQSLGVYRRMIVDNGRGMTSDELSSFFRMFGGGGKPIGPMHENFGVGAKSSLLPWNHAGLVVISWSEESDDPAMIWIELAEDEDEYGLRLEEVENGGGVVELSDVWIPPDEDDEAYGCNWATIRPDWVDDHGTVIVLMGNNPTQWTVNGDPGRDPEAGLNALSGYLNRRAWDVGIEVRAEEFLTADTKRWPRSRGEASSEDPYRRTSRRQIRGARYFIGHQSTVQEGVVSLADSTKVRWHLSEKPSESWAYAEGKGYVSVFYSGELYHTSSHGQTMRMFGIYDKSVRERCWLILEPPEYVNGSGIYPDQSRDALKIAGRTSNDLPLREWAEEFVQNMPDEIADALKQASPDEPSSLQDKEIRERLAGRFADRWRKLLKRAAFGGDSTVDPMQPSGQSRKPRKKRPSKRHKKHPHSGGMKGDPSIGAQDGNKAARDSRSGVALPDAKFVGGDQFDDDYLAAQWVPPSEQFPAGLVQLNRDHPIYKESIHYHQQRHAEHLADQVRDGVEEAYKEVAITKLAHTETLHAHIPRHVIEDAFRSPQALTTALMGFLAEDAVIGPKLGRIGGRKKK